LTIIGSLPTGLDHFTTSPAKERIRKEMHPNSGQAELLLLYELHKEKQFLKVVKWERCSKKDCQAVRILLLLFSRFSCCMAIFIISSHGMQ
jgi:hypothetical protein